MSKIVDRGFWFPDSHIPNEADAYDVALRACQMFKPSLLVIGGDYADCESLSMHEPTSTRGRRAFREEVTAVNRRLDELDAIRSVRRKYYIMGNHEWRLERLLAKFAPALSDCLSIDELFNLTKRGWVVKPYRETLRIGKVNVTHDTGHSGKNAHRQSAQDHMGSTIIFHTHRLAYEVSGKLNGDPYLASMLGWLGDPKKIDYVHQAKAAHWTHGFGLSWHQANGVVHLQPVPIVKGACVVEGKIVK